MSLAFTLKSYFIEKFSNESVMQEYAKTGDQTLLIKLYKENGNDLYHFALTLSDPTLAKDICQKTWLKVIEKKHLYQNTGQFKAWLFTLARNQLIDEFRSNKLITNIQADIEGKPDGILNEPNQDIHTRFNQALLALTFEQKEAFCLQQEGFSLDEISRITHANKETVKSRLRYAKDYLRKQLKRYQEVNHG
ncbi:sigma-70 family RNA polymerase sigma factor [Paraglaciecola aquimarina]|uniref:Sigma-70 family RNA polymerase sigma factor n=1 Tax=Paraglaciecola algarum TaxID=3050085 RepID=A0ABS9DD49_9ALTE|nr:sigma-70 family RNA polymerase sigma factor [Paraglaciecola sp. G1-23]MCF2949913.1 sigma-70 family RNA polymerase sigma factor [Paraglaciecola sp. G1-23]